MSTSGVTGAYVVGGTGSILTGSEVCFIEDKNQTLNPYLIGLSELVSGQKLIDQLNGLRSCGLKLKIVQKPLAGKSFEESIMVSEIFNRQIELVLPPFNISDQINIPILCKKGESFCLQDIQVPAYIAVGHELIHFIHKAKAFMDVQLKSSGSIVTDNDVQNINNWASHRDNCRAIATLYGFQPTENSNSEYSDDSSLGLMDFEDSDFYDNFQGVWGGTKAYEELRTIIGKETSGLSSETFNEFKFQSFELEISERHLLCDYFAKNQLPSTLGKSNENPFVTRWTHALKTEEVEINETSSSLVRNLLTEEEIGRLPSLK